jgi:hypothetical protein
VTTRGPSTIPGKFQEVPGKVLIRRLLCSIVHQKPEVLFEYHVYSSWLSEVSSRFIGTTEKDFRLIDFNAPFEGFPQPRGLIGDAELVLQLTRRHTVGMGCHQMRCAKPCRQRHRCIAVTP